MRMTDDAAFFIADLILGERVIGLQLARQLARE